MMLVEARMSGLGCLAGVDARGCVELTEIESLRLGLGCQEPLLEQVFMRAICERADRELSYTLQSVCDAQCLQAMPYYSMEPPSSCSTSWGTFRQ